MTTPPALDPVPPAARAVPAAAAAPTDKLGSLQIFRGLAAFVVVVFHATTVCDRLGRPLHDDYFLWANAGVDFFFVLSGFIICFFNLRSLGQPAHLLDYAGKRLIRIYPIYWIVTLLILPAYFIAPHLGQGDETHPGVILQSLLLTPMSRTPILVAGWTLRHELLFYVVFGLLIAIRHPAKWLLAGGWVVAVAANLALSFNHPGYYRSGPTLLLWPQNFEFMLGCAAAVLVAKLPRASVPRAAWVAALTLGLLAFPLTGFLPAPFLDLKLGEHVALFGTLSFVIVIASSLLDLTCDPADRWRRSAPYRGLFFLGDASYSLYLIHGPSLSVLFKLANRGGWLERFGTAPVAWLCIAVTVVIGGAFHVIAERPLLRVCRRAFFRRQAHS